MAEFSDGDLQAVIQSEISQDTANLENASETTPKPLSSDQPRKSVAHDSTDIYIYIKKI